MSAASVYKVERTKGTYGGSTLRSYRGASIIKGRSGWRVTYHYFNKGSMVEFGHGSIVQNTLATLTQEIDNRIEEGWVVHRGALETPERAMQREAGQ